MLKVFNRLLDDYKISEITAAQGRVMFPLWQNDNLSFQSLKKKTMLSKATLSYMLDKLEDTGHIERVRSEEDKRTIYIKLTKKNKELQDKFVKISKEMSNLFYKGFSEEAIDMLESYLRQILDNLLNYQKK
ncbi:MAG: MarR family transcriptional regulator [Candidatus Lokiarchaeia archaeon]|nr:MarR family transcriptional regulator [Candidatus Lokiarchaeia archaeon]